MRTRSAALATFAALAGIGLAAVPANAASAPAPVSSISVTPQIDSRGTVSVDVSWTGADPSADGVVVCLKRGTSAPATPDTCESNVAVNPPATRSLSRPDPHRLLVPPPAIAPHPQDPQEPPPQHDRIIPEGTRAGSRGGAAGLDSCGPAGSTGRSTTDPRMTTAPPRCPSHR